MTVACTGEGLGIKMLQILMDIVIVALAIFGGFYIFYYVICLRYIKIHNPKKPSGFKKESLPSVSIIIPVYNEANVLTRRIENLEGLRYPRDKLEVVFVDGGSSDGGIDLIQKLARKTKLSIKLICQGRRKGFNSAIIEGFAETTGDIICITGAETEYDPNALDMMVQHFAHPRIGAVTGRQMIRNVDEGFSPKLEVAYRGLYDLVREAESYIDSPFDIKGEICAARRSVVKNLVEKPELLHKGCIDACFSFQARKDGYKTVYDPRAVYFELSPKSIRDSFKQQIRRATTLIQNMMAFKDMILNTTYGAFGLFIMPAHFLMLVILPFVFLVGVIGMVVAIALNPSNYLFLAIICLALLATFLSSRLQAFLKTQIVLAIATLGLLGFDTQKFERLASTRP